MKEKVFKGIKEYVLIGLGTLMLTVGVYFFKIPNGFATGGVSGIGTILGKITPNVSAGSWIMIINVVLLLLGFAGQSLTNAIIACAIFFTLWSAYTVFLFRRRIFKKRFANAPVAVWKDAE